MISNETTYQDLLDDVQQNDSVSRQQWLESMHKHHVKEIDRLYAERLEVLLMKPIWGAVGMAIGLMGGAFATWLSFYFDGVTRQ